jgi:hypothetical protein
MPDWRTIVPLPSSAQTRDRRRERRPIQAATHDEPQAVEDLAQIVAALRRVLVHQRYMNPQKTVIAAPMELLNLGVVLEA